MRRTAWVLGVAVALWTAGAVEARAQGALEHLVRETPDRARDSIAQLVRAGLASGPAAGEAGREALRLAAAYSKAWSDPFLETRTRWVLARRGGDRVAFLRADSLRREGNDALFRSGVAAARANWGRARNVFARLGDSVGVTLVVGNIGASYFEEGRLDSAVVFLHRALDGAVRHRDWRTAGNAATILGSVARERGSPREAIQWNLRAVDLHRAGGNYSGVAADFNNAGLIAEELDDRATAERHYAAALDVSRTRLGGEREADYLVNLAAVHARRGARGEARTELQRALALYQTEGEHANVAVVHHVLGTLDAESSDYDTAAAEYRLAIDAYHRVGNTRGEVEVRRLLASLYAGMGRPDEALEEVSRAAAALGRLAPPAPELGAAVAVVEGDIELLLNRAEDARPSYLEAERLARAVGNRPLLAEAIQGTAQIELRGRAYHAVVRRLEELLTIQPAGRDRGWTSLLLGSAYGELGDSGRAQSSFRSASADFEAAEDQAGLALTLGASARVAASQHLVWRALNGFAQARAEARGLPAIRWWLHLETGRVMERAGDLGGAAVQYDSALTVIEGLADWVRFNDRRAMFLEDKWEAYEARAALAARLGRPGEAIAFSERLRARYLLDLLAERRPMAPKAGALRAEERRLRDEIGRLSGRALADARGHRGESMVSGLETREALVSAQEEYRRLLDRMRAEEPVFARGLRGETVSAEAISRALRPDELLIEYLVTTDRLWIFAVTDTGVVDFATPVGHATIRTQIDFVRWAMDKRRDDEALWRGALRGLDDVLIEPIRRAGLLAGRTSLIIVPHRELHYLPFEALIDSVRGRDRYLVETFDVAYAPSASVWLQLRRRPRPADHGVVALAPRDRELVGTAEEVSAVASVWGSEALIHLGREATAGALHTAGGSYRIVHLATRGVLDRRNPLFSYVELAPELNGDDGRLEVHEVYRMTLKTDLLVLTACQTGLGSGSVADVPNGDDWVSLVRAFVSAGANNVLATLWAIDDARTAVLAAAVHRHIAAGASYARALALAKRESLRRSDMAAPYYWAGLVLSGAQRRR